MSHERLAESPRPPDAAARSSREILSQSFAGERPNGTSSPSATKRDSPLSPLQQMPEPVRERIKQELKAAMTQLRADSQIELRTGEGPADALERRQKEAKAKVDAGIGTQLDKKLASMTDEEILATARKIRDRDFAQMKDENGRPRHYYKTGEKISMLSEQQMRAAFEAKKTELIKKAGSETAKQPAKKGESTDLKTPATDAGSKNSKEGGEPTGTTGAGSGTKTEARTGTTTGVKAGDGTGSTTGVGPGTKTGDRTMDKTATAQEKLTPKEVPNFFVEAYGKLDYDMDKSITRQDVLGARADSSADIKVKQLAEVVGANFDELAALHDDKDTTYERTPDGDRAKVAQVTKADMQAFDSQRKELAENQEMAAFLDKNFKALSKDGLITQESLTAAINNKQFNQDDLRTILKVRDAHFDSLTQKHNTWWDQGIDRKDVEAYQSELANSRIGKLVTKVNSQLAG